MYNPSRPPQWSICLEPESGDELLRIGNRHIRVADISACEADKVADINLEGHISGSAFFLGLGALLLLPVTLGILPLQSLVGAVMFVAIGFSLAADILQSHWYDLHRVVIYLASGGSTIFTSPDAATCQALIAALETRTDA